MRILLLLLVLPLADEWSTAASLFKLAIDGSNDEKLQKAVVAVAKDNSERASKLLLTGLTTTNPRFYWIIINGLSKMPSKEAVAPVTEAILAKKTPGDQRRDLMMALQLNPAGTASDALLLVAKDGTPDVQVQAVDELVNRLVKEAVPVFIGLLKSNEAELKRRVLKALVALTGADAGTTAAAWQTWWDANHETWKPGAETAKTDPDKPGKTVVEVIKKGRKTDVEDLKKGDKKDIVVVEGVFDTVQDVLDKMSIPHTKIGEQDLAKFDLSKTMALLINCGVGLEEKNGGVAQTMSKADLAKVREFVARGGYLFTSDWGLTEVLEGAFPGYCKMATSIDQATVDIFPKKGSTGHPFLKEVFVKVKIEGGEGKSSTKSEEKIDFQWVIDGASFSIDYDPAKVICLVEAPDLEDQKHTAVAVTFAFGEKQKDPKAVATGGVYEDLAKMTGGRVLHVLSHFGTQKTKNDEYAIQNMLLNFVIEAKDRKQMKKK